MYARFLRIMILGIVSIALQSVQRFAVDVHKNLRLLEEARNRFIVGSRSVRSTECA